MTHVGQESCFSHVRLFSNIKRFYQYSALFQGFPHFRIDDCKTNSYSMNDMIIPIRRMANARHSKHLIVVGSIPMGKISVGNDAFCGKRRANIVRFDELEEPCPILFIDVFISIFDESLVVRKMQPLHVVVRITRIRTIAYGLVDIQIHMINAAVI